MGEILYWCDPKQVQSHLYDYRSNMCDFASDSTLILIINLRSQPMLLHVVSLVEVNSGPVQDVHG